MSTFRKYYSFLIDIGTNITDWKDEFKLALTENNWVVVRENDTNLLVRPPITETIGTDRGHGILHVSFTSSNVTFAPRLWYAEEDGAGYTLRFRNSLSGYVSHLPSGNSSMSYRGNTVNFTTTSAEQNSGNLRTEGQYAALVAAQTSHPDIWGILDISLDTSGTDWDIVITTPADWQDIQWTEPHPNITSTNMTFTRVFEPYTKPLMYGFSNSFPSVTVDFSTGFIYFLSVFDRSISLATKTTVNYFGPISAVWVDNEIAVQQTPTGLIPPELFAIDCSTHNTTNFRFDAVPTHGIGYHANTSTTLTTLPHSATPQSNNSYQTSIPLPLPLGVSDSADPRGEFSELSRAFVTPTGVTGANAYAAGISHHFSLLFGSQFPIVNVELFREAIQQTHATIYGYYMETTSSFLDEVYMFTQTATNESLHLARIVEMTTTMGSEASAEAVTLTVGDTSLFPSEGTLIIGNEILSYTGKTPTTFTGVTRGLYGTAAEIHEVNEVVYSTRWFVKINAGAMVAGTTKPEAAQT